MELQLKLCWTLQEVLGMFYFYFFYKTRNVLALVQLELIESNEFLIIIFDKHFNNFSLLNEYGFRFNI